MDGTSRGLLAGDGGRRGAEHGLADFLVQVGGVVVGLETLAAAVALLGFLFLLLLAVMMMLMGLEVGMVVFLGIDAGGD